MEYSDVEKIHIKNNNGLQDNELEVFLAAAGRYGLNPLANQIYARVSGGRSGRRLGFMTGIDGYRAIADRTGSYAGNDDPVFDSEENPQKATVTVYKIVGGHDVRSLQPLGGISTIQVTSRAACGNECHT